MKIDLHKNRDFWAGILLIGIGSAAIFIARDYRFGSVMRMGPGFFPIILSGILIAFGICISVMGVLKNEKIQSPLSLRALILLSLSLLAFGILMKQAGFVPAIAVLIILSAASGSEFNLKEVLLLVVVLAALSIALFIWGLGLPYSLFKGF